MKVKTKQFCACVTYIIPYIIQACCGGDEDLLVQNWQACAIFFFLFPYIPILILTYIIIEIFIGLNILNPCTVLIFFLLLSTPADLKKQNIY